MTSLHLTVLRHARSRADGNVHGGRHDSPLNPGGEAQAAALATSWPANPPGFDRAFCSALQRAHGMAHIVRGTRSASMIPTCGAKGTMGRRAA